MLIFTQRRVIFVIETNEIISWITEKVSLFSENFNFVDVFKFVLNSILQFIFNKFLKNH